MTEFAGTDEEALQAGWADEDWGMTCPTCLEELGRQEEGVLFSGAASLKNLASVLKGEV